MNKAMQRLMNRGLAINIENDLQKAQKECSQLFSIIFKGNSLLITECPRLYKKNIKHPKKDCQTTQRLDKNR
jgi:hypothetical protein